MPALVGVEGDGTYLGGLTSLVSGQTLRAHRNDRGTDERFKQALASWMVDELRREVEGGRSRSEWVEDLYGLDVDVLTVERLAIE